MKKRRTIDRLTSEMTEENMDQVAFLITVYKNDNVEYFQDAIESIVNQDYDFKYICIYLGIDGPIPDTISNYINNNQEIFYKVIQNETNRGLAHTLNSLIDVLEDEKYIFRMDSDDICAPNRVSEQIKTFQNDKELLLIGTDLIEIDHHKTQLRSKKMPTQLDDIIHYSIARNPFNHPTVAVRKEFFNIVGTYNGQILKSQDYELWARALKKNIKVANLSKPLLYFRITSDYMQKRNAPINYINEFKISMGLMIHFKKYTQFPKILIKLLIRLLPYSIGNYFYKMTRN